MSFWRRPSGFIVLILASLFTLSSFAAPVYRWVDKNGQVHFSDQPPPVKKEVVSDTDITSEKRKKIRKAEGKKTQQSVKSVAASIPEQKGSKKVVKSIRNTDRGEKSVNPGDARGGDFGGSNRRGRLQRSIY